MLRLLKFQYLKDFFPIFFRSELDAESSERKAVLVTRMLDVLTNENANVQSGKNREINISRCSNLGGV